MARMGRDHWLALGLSALMEAGPEAMTIEALTARAGKTRGSFYHHFPDRDGFVDGILDLWRRRAMTPSSWPNAAPSDPDLALERAARRMKEAGPIVAAVDAARLSRLREAQAAPKSPAAADYAELILSVFLGVLASPDINAVRARTLLDLTRDMIAAHWDE